MSANPLVSIIIDNYNYEQFLLPAIDSALAQTYQNTEIIVVDDGSTDNSPEIITHYGNKIIPLLKTNNGQASAFNAGFAQSKGEIICFLDADDLFMPDKVTKIVTAFVENPEIGWCFHPLKLVDSQHQSLNYEQNYTGESGVYDIRSAIAKGKLNGRLPFNSIATSGLCYRRNLLERLLPMPESIKITSDDYLKYAAFALTPGYALLEELSWQTIHDNNAYTLRTDKDALRAKINIVTAYLLKQKIPSMVKFTNNIFALGLSIYRRLAEREQKTLAIIEEYFSGLKTTDKIEINLRSLYYRYKK